MVSISRTMTTSAKIGTRIKFLLGVGALLLLGIILSFYLIWKSTIFLSPAEIPNTSQSVDVVQEVRSWALNYQDLAQAPTRHKAFWELTTILQTDEDAAQAIEKVILSQQQNYTTGLLAIAVGVLSSQGTPEAQKSLCNILQVFNNNDEKAMVVLPQIMLLEQPQNFLFDELQAFIRNSPNVLLRENAELVLTGLSQRAVQTNESLAQKITLWLQQKKAEISGEPESLEHYLDLLGNTTNEAFLDEILPALTHQNTDVRERAVFALRLFQNQRAVSALNNQLLVDQSPQVKRKVKEALSYFHSVQDD